MFIQVKLDDYDFVEIQQSDIEDMWNYLIEDTENFLYGACLRIKGLDLDYWKEDESLRDLYKVLKDIYEE